MKCAINEFDSTRLNIKTDSDRMFLLYTLDDFDLYKSLTKFFTHKHFIFKPQYIRKHRISCKATTKTLKECS